MIKTMRIKEIKHIKRLRKNANPYKILKYLAVGSGIILISLIAPTSGAILVKELLNGYIRRRAFEKQRFLKDLKNLQIRKLISYKELDNGIVEIAITNEGKQQWLIYKIDELQLKKPKHWDRKWRLIIFDIPHHLKKNRDVLSQKLRQLQFHHLQKSVYLIPYPCEDEIDFLTTILEIRKYILILYVNHFEGEEKFKHHFGI